MNSLINWGCHFGRVKDHCKFAVNRQKGQLIVMAKKGMIERNLRRTRVVEKYASQRAELKRQMADPEIADEEFYAAQRKLACLPRNSSRVRIRNRCSVTGRPRAYLRKYRLSRITFRELASQGQIPGVTKSSW